MQLIRDIYCVMHYHLSFCQLHNRQLSNNEYYYGVDISVMEGAKQLCFQKNKWYKGQWFKTVIHLIFFNLSLKNHHNLLRNAYYDGVDIPRWREQK